jgi:hypothetical protein
MPQLRSRIARLEPRTPKACESIVPPKAYGSGRATRPVRVIDNVIGPGAGQGCFFDGTDGFEGHDAGIVHVLQYETWSDGVHWDRRTNSGPRPWNPVEAMAIS